MNLVNSISHINVGNGAKTELLSTSLDSSVKVSQTQTTIKIEAAVPLCHSDGISLQ